MSGGGGSPGDTNVITYITIATLGNSKDFGDLTVSRQTGQAAVSSPTRGVWGGGEVSPTGNDTIDYVQIMSTGNAVDFGNLVNGANFEGSGCSNGHGGLGN